MASEEHGLRSRIVAKAQHPYPHAAGDIAFNHPAFPGVTRLDGFLNVVAAVLYPQDKDSVATVGDLPAVGNAINDYRVVLDGGDGQAEGWRWYQHEGEAAASWHKVADYDWSSDGILAQFYDKTLEHYVSKFGFDDLDPDGVAFTGVDSGQHVYGGRTANTHLTLHANSGDGVGAQTGFVQFADNARPTVDGVFDLGESTRAFNAVWASLFHAGTTTLGSGVLTDDNLLISMGTTALSTGDYFQAGTLKIASGSITDTSGAIAFGDEDLSTTGDFSAHTGTFDNVQAIGAASAFAADTVIGDLTVGSDGTGGAALASGAFAFAGGLFDTTGCTSTALSEATAPQLTVSPGVNQLLLSAGSIAGDVLGITATTSIGLSAPEVDVFGPLTCDSGIIGTSFVATAGLFSAPNGNLDLSSAANITIDGHLVPNAPDGALSLGEAVTRFSKLYLKSAVGCGISDGTDTILTSVLMSLRTVLTGATEGMSLFFDGETWVPSLPDTEIDHGAITGLLDDDHTQYALLVGRAGGQTLVGGTAASENLLLRATADATAGSVLWLGTLSPNSDNTYDIGAGGARVKDLYLAGQAFGLRLENATTAGRPAASGTTKGRMIWDTDLLGVFVDLGGTWAKVGAEKVTYQDAVTWDGATLTKTYTVDGTDGAITGKVTDARLAIWSLKDNTNDFEQVGCDITATATTVTITVGEYLPIGTYTLVGVG